MIGSLEIKNYITGQYIMCPAFNQAFIRGVYVEPKFQMSSPPTAFYITKAYGNMILIRCKHAQNKLIPQRDHQI